MAALDDPLRVGGVRLRNRLYRAPSLECAGNGPDAVQTFIDELEPAAEAGAGLRSLGLWHAEHRERNPGETQAAVSQPPWQLRLADRAGIVDPVLCEGGIRERDHCERLLGTRGDPPACDMVGMGRPFYAEPRLPARLLAGDGRTLCESYNNCTIPQATGEPGRCRTPAVVRERARREQAGEYERGEETGRDSRKGADGVS